MDLHKKKTLYIVIVILLVLVMVILSLIYIYNNRVDGQITVMGSDVIVKDAVSCVTMDDDHKNISIKCESILNGIKFRNVTYFGCIYVFTIQSGDISVHPVIHYHRSTLGKPEQWKMRFAFHEENGKWDVTVYGKRNELTESTIICRDVEKNGINIDFWEENGALTEYR